MTDPASPDPPPPVDLRVIRELTTRVIDGVFSLDVMRAAFKEIDRLEAEVANLRAAAPQRQEPPTS